MKVSSNVIKKFLDFELPATDELVQRINQQLGGVEEVIDLGAKYKGAVIVKVIKCDKHPNADKLSVCEIDAGTGENIQVVCGAPNVRAGMFTVWLPPKSTVPATFDDKEPFVLEARELRGVTSSGMLASAKELAISDSHDGILEINPSEWKPSGIEVTPGASFAEVYGLNDTIIDIENKMFTHRPDCFGQLGVAREIAGILGHQFKSPNWYLDAPKFESVNDLKLEVFNDAPEKAPRFMAVALKEVEIKPSPLWLQCALVAMGSKSINNIVDVTNYIMLLTAQPTHAYDYDKLRGGKLGTRMAQKGEKATLLNGKEYEFGENDIVIADGEGVIGLGGIMGGLDSEVTSETKNIVLECANFDMYTLRRSSMRHGLFTDALTRFNKGQSPLQNPNILNLLMMSIKDVSSTAQQASDVFDESQTLGQEERIEVTPDFINARLGLELESDGIGKLLKSVEFEVEGNEALHITNPFWRTDIEIPEDIVEEVGRLYGFDKLPRELPKRSIAPATKNQLFELKSQIRQSLARAGANEVLTYSFVHANLLEKVGQNPENAFKLSNALSPDLQYYRLSLTPSLLDKVHANIKAGYDEFSLFEIGKTHAVDSRDEDGLPHELERLALVIAGKQKAAGAAYYRARTYLTNILASLQVAPEHVQFEPLEEGAGGAPAYYQPGRLAAIRVDEAIVGYIGEYKPSVQKALKLPEYCAGFEVDLTYLLSTKRTASYIPLSRYPKIEQDISLQVASTTLYADLYGALAEALGRAKPADVTTYVEPLDIYQGDDTSHKNITFRVRTVSYERTLQAEVVNTLLDAVAADVHDALGAVRL